MEFIIQARTLKEELDALRPLSPEDEQRIMQKFRLDWNYHSNHLEGNSLSYGETKALILFGLTAQGKPLKDHLEISGHDEAVKWIEEVVKEERPLNESFIRSLHTLILKESYESAAITPEGKQTTKRIQVGQYKSQPNHVKTQTGEIFRFATPEETPAMMADLIEWYRAESEKENAEPILLAAKFHYDFIRIHPFDDGNGRSARLLMNFILMRFGYPPVIIKTEDKQRYFGVLRLADAGDIDPFIGYVAENLAHSLELMIKGARGESIEEPDDIDKQIALLEQKLNSKNLLDNQVRSYENIRNVFRVSLTRLIDSLSSKTASLDKFFATKSIRSNVSHSAFTHKSFVALKVSLGECLNIQKNDLTILEISIIYSGFKSRALSIGKVSIGFVVNFDDNYFVFRGLSAGNMVSHGYGVQLSDEEIESLISNEIKSVLEKIEKAM